MANFFNKFSITKKQDTNNTQIPTADNRATQSKTAWLFGKLAIVFCLVIVSWLLVILANGCGDVTSEVTSISISPSTAKIGINKTALFQVIAKDNSGKIVLVTPTWSITGNIGTISSTGLLYASSLEGSGKVKAIANGLSAEASVTVTAKGWVVGLVLDEIGNKVQGLNVYLQGAGLSDYTDSKGNYSISDVPAGDYMVYTSQTAVYKPSSQEVIVGSGETTRSDFVIYYFSRPPTTTLPTL